MISILVTFAGFLAAVSIFLYFLSTVDTAKRSVKKIAGCDIEIGRNGGTETISKKTIRDLSDEEKNRIPGRKCPLCMKILTRDEPLYASFVETAGTRKVLIYGCPYCWKDSKEDR